MAEACRNLRLGQVPLNYNTAASHNLFAVNLKSKPLQELLCLSHELLTIVLDTYYLITAW